MKTIVVENVFFAGTYGGAIFSGTCEEGLNHRMVARYDVMPRSPVAGEVWKVEGTVQNHPTYGRQIVTTKALLVRPSGRLICTTIAKSSTFRGIGEKLADRLWRRFGEDIYQLLDKGDPAPFVGPLESMELARTLVNGWREFAPLADTYQWLDRHGVPVWLAQKLVFLYGDEVIYKLEENPYRLLAFTKWETVDRIARSLGIGLEDERRLVAAADAAVVKRLQQKHTWATEDEFRTTIHSLIKCPPKTATLAVELAIKDNALVRVEGGLQGLGPASMEEYIATLIKTMTAGHFQADQRTIRQAPNDQFIASFLHDFHARKKFRLNKEQQSAVQMALTEPVSIICGGAGVGKTTVLEAVCAATESLGGQVIMMALSGRAARRMSVAGRKAMTIASFLKRIDRGELVLNAEPTIAIDEASMLDLPTTYRLLRRLEPGCRLLLLGDPGQLPPISFGVVFHVLVETRAVPQVELTEIHRQAAATGIPQASNAIRSGTVPALKAYTGIGTGVQFIDCGPDEIPGLLMAIAADMGGFDSVRIVSPVKNGVGGTREVNALFHHHLAHGKRREHEGFAEGEPVIWLENNYDLELMNGSLGKVVRADGVLVIDWEGEEKTIENPQEMDLAYCITVHKSQGSQFKRCILPIFRSRLLDRTMVYTAITRAEEQVVLVGDREAFEAAVKAPPSTSIRRSGLHFALAKANAQLLPAA